MRSEAQDRGVFETIVYGLFILSAIFSIGYFVSQPVTVPAVGLHRTTTAVDHAMPVSLARS